MGSKQSSEVKQSTEILNKNVVNVVTKNVNKAGAANNNNNSFELITGPKSDIKNCSLNIGQRINASQQIKAMSKATSLADMQSTMKSAIDSAMSQSSEATNSFLSTAFNDQKNKSEITAIMKNEVEQNVTTENLTECNGIIDNINQGRLEFNGKWDCGKQGNITVNQEILTAQVVECYSDAIQEALMKNSSIADAVNKAEQRAKSTNTGIGEAVSSILSSFMGPYAMIIIAIVIAMVVAIPLLLFAFKKGGGKLNMPTINVPNPLEKPIAQFLKRASRR